MAYRHSPLNLKKSLGQHFLKDEQVCQRIVESVNQFPYRMLLEIGPGAGALTKHLADQDDVEFKAVEIDREKVNYLKSHFPSLADKIVESDFLTVEMPFSDSFSIVGNFPYNISTEILFKILGWREYVERVTGMFQKEVAM